MDGRAIEGARPEFLFYLPYARLSETHQRAPWIMFGRSFAALGYRATLLCGKFDVTPVPAGVDVVETGRTSNSSMFRRFFEAVLDPVIAFRRIGNREPDLVMIGPLGPAILTSLLLMWLYRHWPGSPRRRRTRFVLKADANLLNYGVGRGLSRMMDALLVASSRGFDVVTVETFCSLHRARSLSGARSDVFFRLPSGYPQGVLARRGYTDGGPREHRILCAARIVPHKGQDVLLRAFESLAPEFPDWTVRIVGDPVDRAYAAHLEELARRPALAGRVVFGGFQAWPEMEREFERAAIFCLPTLHESEGTVKYEATILGAPVVTTEVPCAFDAREAGWIVAHAGDPAELSRRLHDLMQDDDLRRRTVATAQSRLRSYLDRARELLARLGEPPTDPSVGR